MRPLTIFFLCLLSSNYSCSQYKAIDNYIIDLKDVSDPAFGSLDSILLRRSNNLFLLSESNHPDLNLAKIRYLLTIYLSGLTNIQIVIDEFPFAGSSMLFGFLNGEIQSSMLHDSVYSIGYYEEDIPENAKELNDVSDYIDFEFESYVEQSTIAEEYMYYLANKMGHKVIAIDIGFRTHYLEKSYLAWLTKRHCFSPYVQAVCDSIVNHTRGEFQLKYVFRDSEQTFERKLKAREVFLDSLLTHCQDSSLYFGWKNAFAGYLFSQRTKRKSILDPEFRPLTTLEFMEENSFRDSILYENFKWAMPDSFENVIVSFSTLHLMDSRKTDDFSDVMTANTKTLGRYLHNDTIFSKYLKRIAFICDDTHRKDEKFKNSNAKQSLEYELSKKYNIAYIDLEGYRNAIPKTLRKPFYMRPTFWTYRKLNWEEIFDGIVFVKDCGCVNR